MTYTPFGNLTNEELLKHVWSKPDTPTALELELAQRLTAFVDEEQDCGTIGRIAIAETGGVLNDA